MTDWDSLRYILAVAREGGLSGAARVLGVNHATVSRQLSKAEEKAGVRFFTRLASGLQPTDAGRVAITHAEDVESRMVALDMALAARDETEEGELKITIPPLLGSDHFAKDIKEFKDLHPGIDLHVAGATEVLNLHRREADVAIRVTHSPEESLWGRMAVQQRAGWFATPEFIEQYREVFEGRDTETSVPYVCYAAWSAACVSGFLNEVPVSNVSVVTEDTISAMALARQGMGMVRAPYVIGSADPALSLVPGLTLTDHVPIWILTHPDLRHVPRVTEFMRFIAGRFAARRSSFMGPDSTSGATVITPDRAKLEGSRATEPV